MKMNIIYVLVILFRGISSQFETTLRNKNINDNYFNVSVSKQITIARLTFLTRGLTFFIRLQIPEIELKKVFCFLSFNHPEHMPISVSVRVGYAVKQWLLMSRKYSIPTAQIPQYH